ncbi:preprotein translocase subunit SECE1 [Mercurialis annua]|uniref:preprotein translocase subunit SECE1 n=1 Tax=Mercurialis annua TaxID=3986 RepID=UPI0021601D10|nr:preprotein translocase subunit SECE1 [Mercurialis annua]
MAVASSLSLNFTLTTPPPLRINQPNTISQFKPPPITTIGKLKTAINAKSRRNRVFLIRAVEEESKKSVESEAVQEAELMEDKSRSELGEEIKKAMMERKEKEKEDGGLLSGVAEEVQEIEWPAFGKVLGITGVVLGVIAGSSVVLLTVNAVFAELSDRVFVGRGVQDFFG